MTNENANVSDPFGMPMAPKYKIQGSESASSSRVAGCVAHRLDQMSPTPLGCRKVMLIVFAMSMLISISTFAETIVVEASESLPGDVNFILKWARHNGYSWLDDQFKGKHFITKNTIFRNPAEPHKNLRDEPSVFTVIPGLNGKITPDYLIRIGPRNCFLLNKIDGAFDSTHISNFDCSKHDTAALVKARAECSVVGGSWDIGDDFPDGYCVADSRKRCNDRGGAWKRVGMANRLRCVTPFPDGGMDCTDNSECIGGCIYVGKKADATEIIHGECRPDDAGGGSTHIYQGRLGPPGPIE